MRLLLTQAVSLSKLAAKTLPVTRAATLFQPSTAHHSTSNMSERPAKRSWGKGMGGPRKKKKSKRERNITECSSEEVIQADIQDLLSGLSLQDAAGLPSGGSAETREIGTQVQVRIHAISSTGDGIGTLATPTPNAPPEVFLVPFSVTGDVVLATTTIHNPSTQLHPHAHTITRFDSVVTPSPQRDDSRVKCQYFNSCGGCQFQQLSYADQLAHKRDVLVRAFANFSKLAPEQIPEIGETVASPLEYGYRTKLTPHFQPPSGYRDYRRGVLDAKGKFRGDGKDRITVGFQKCPDIGFMYRGEKRVIDIEDCPIGTDAVRAGMKRERGRMHETFDKYENGATILLRESTKRHPKNDDGSYKDQAPETSDAVVVEHDTHTDVKTCITDHKAASTEFVDSQVFVSPAGSFFQNNNSIIPVITSYIRDNILPKSSTEPQIKHLIDAYSGSGLFTITLSTLPTLVSSTGIDIDSASIRSATQNRDLNDIPHTRARFIAADAQELFKSVKYDSDETVVVLDPPRRGCDEVFLRQLLEFGPRRVAYVSCNVHTQARDVGVLVRGLGELEPKGEKKTRYRVDSLRGFDFFPQTAHVEGVAFLDRVDEV